MASVMGVDKNPYHENPKRSDIYTPAPVSEHIFDLLADRDYNTVLDPAIGGGSLTRPWRASGCTILGCDIDGNAAASADKWLDKDFLAVDPEDVADWPCPDLILINPPFNRGRTNSPNDKAKAKVKSGHGLPPERFLRQTIRLFGAEVPVVLFCPMGMTLNQRRHSKRSRWMRDHAPAILSILSLPLDVFPGVEFHQLVLFFNIPGLPAHHFLPESVIQAIYQQEVRVDVGRGVYWRQDQAGWDELESYEAMTEATAKARKFKPFKPKDAEKSEGVEAEE